MSVQVGIHSDEDSDESLILGGGGSRHNERQELLGSSSEDDFFLQGPRVSLQHFSNDNKFSGLKSKVEEVTNVMKDNVNRVLERNDRLDSLQERSDRLNDLSSAFTSTASAMRGKAWWENNKAKGILGVATSVIVIIIIISIF
uniref:Vesicle-associated membrane protein 4 n=1 Tax=Caligus clemensi TaxID=344056 RepID=C1C1F1_CALCM|nr:Vesicle-associated membrane protein 4 [Caligus clemensi]